MLQVTQDSNFDISASGTATLNGTTTNFTLTPNSGASSYNNVIGAVVSASGTATNVNGSTTLQVFGHFTPDASQVSFAALSNGVWSVGTLTKQ